MPTFNENTNTYEFQTDEEGAFTIPGGLTIDTNALGNAKNNSITGDARNNLLNGGKGDDTLHGGGGGVDTLIGGLGNDYFYIDEDDSIDENSNEGSDTVEIAFDYALAVNPYVEHLVLAGTGDFTGSGNDTHNSITGNTGANTLVGGKGNDTLNGRAGNDILLGGAGNDSLTGGEGDDALEGGSGNDLYVISEGDTIVENANEGTDTVITDEDDFFIDENFENLTLAGAAIKGWGNKANNVLVGNEHDNNLEGKEGRDTLIGSDGNDTLSGGKDSDTYIIDAGDTIIELANEGSDTVETSFNYTLGSNLENLKLTGAANLTGTGNELSNFLYGNSGNNTLSGGGSWDVLDGGAGADYMVGGTDSDTYIVDNAGDVAVEAAGEGSDLVVTLISYTLGAEVEKLESAEGVFHINLTGNALNNRVTGSDGDNMIDGGAGADEMEGEGGNDTFVVDNALDTVLELAGEGIDTVQASASFTLAATSEVEVLTATGSGDLSLQGSDIANTVTGNASMNTLMGMGGNDVIDGGLGNDALDGGAGNDVLQGGDGADVVTGDLDSDIVDGGLGSDRLNGGLGNDMLKGGIGNDTITGGAGKDVFVLNAKLGTAKTDRKVNFDNIADFNVKDDSLYLDNFIFKTLGKGAELKPGKLNKKFFHQGDKAKDGNDYLVYNKKTGVLSYDMDGSGKSEAVEITLLKKKLKLTAADFFVI